ncbi:hypothetical protein HJG54_17730 [Leptolyngbya sp. NK1-12]|uniref:Uncharacterized protein n=1 Tax=Leptolyngbya sp. NK1-12 TaxID=2547451 RepID=A0AA97AJ40_9CYAN|nr:hypothetical protein [Leptolyngbya sp. NK1-12]WNZ24511.1 hypothetical protein HJG54_17730 [Leptolyngbya sp. NK1-12]
MSIASISILSVLIAACLVGDVAALLNGKTVSTDAGVPPWPEWVGLGLVIWLFTEDGFSGAAQAALTGERPSPYREFTYTEYMLNKFLSYVYQNLQRELGF